MCVGVLFIRCCGYAMTRRAPHAEKLAHTPRACPFVLECTIYLDKIIVEKVVSDASTVRKAADVLEHRHVWRSATKVERWVVWVYIYSCVSGAECVRNVGPHEHQCSSSAFVHERTRRSQGSIRRAVLLKQARSAVIACMGMCHNVQESVLKARSGEYCWA